MECSGCGKDHEVLGAFRVGRCCMCGEAAITCSDCSDAYDKYNHYQTIMCRKHYSADPLAKEAAA